MSAGCEPLASALFQSGLTEIGTRYDPVVQDDLMNSIILPLYASSEYASVDAIHPHRLSVFFTVLASGAFWEDHPTAKVLAHQYHTLARAALSLKSIIREASSASVQALFTIIRFLHFSDANAGEERWLLGGVCVRIAQIVCHSLFSREFGSLMLARSVFVSISYMCNSTIAD